MCISSLSVHAETLMVATAANFKPVLDVLKPHFEVDHPNTQLKLVSGSSGKLFAQIVHGAPFDVFLSADEEKPSKLVALGLADEASKLVYAQGKLVLWSADSNRLKGNTADVLKADFQRLALANAKLAPYGLAAEQVLTALGMIDTTRSKWVVGESIAQTFQFVFTGNAELGFVAKSQVWQNGALQQGSVWLIPDDMYQPILQEGVVLNKSQNKALGKAFLGFLAGKKSQSILEKYGYQELNTAEN